MFSVPAVESFEAALKDKSINAVAIFTQRHLHGDMTVAALNAGKHVYSAVPTGITVEEIMRIEEAVRRTGLIFHTGETGYYRPCTVLCREAYTSGALGDFVYGESQYNHDIRNMYDSFRHSGGEDWKKYAGFPPMFYPTHSTSMILGAMPGVHVKKVTAFGWLEKCDLDIYGDGQNLWNNPFTNTAMLAELSNGGTARISENRRVCWTSPESYISQFYGTEGSYEFSVAHHYYAKWQPCEDPRRSGRKDVFLREISEYMQPESVFSQMNTENGIDAISKSAGFSETSPIQPTWRLPESYSGKENGHNGCHHFMVDDFCKAVAEGKLSPTNIWASARFNIPGLIAHESALKGGILIDVPDLGDPPSDWKLLRPDGTDSENPIAAKIYS